MRTVMGMEFIPRKGIIMSETALTPQEMGRRGGRARALALSPERRREIAHKAHLAGSVNLIARCMGELSEEQKDKITNALYDLGEAGS
jgi:general stress protein YciG